MKKLYMKTQKWLENPDFPEWKVHRIAFGWMLMQYGDLVTVKAGGEEITLKLEHVEGGRPMWYESAPIEPELAEKIYGHPIQPLNEGEAVILNVGVNATLECWKKGERDPRWVLPVDIDTLRIVK